MKISKMDMKISFNIKVSTFYENAATTLDVNRKFLLQCRKQ